MLSLLAQDAAPQQQPQSPQPGGGLLSMLLLLAPIMLIWWLLVIRPQSKQEKARRKKLEAIQKGDRVRTRGGLLGTVTRMKEDELTLRVDNEGKVHVQVARAYVDEVLTEEPSTSGGPSVGRGPSDSGKSS